MAYTGAAGTYDVYVGTYTTTQSKGIYMFRFDGSVGRAETPKLVAEAVNPSFLDFTPDGRLLFAVNETDQTDGQQGGAVSAYSVDSRTGELKFLNRVSTRGAGPCHLAVDPSGKCVVVANYGGGSVAAFQIGSDGSLGEARSSFQHRGRSVNPRRQEAPHAHGVTFDAAGRFVFVPDLGLDQIVIYRVSAAE
ncbi:MAG: lactonase family protein, partial [Verrucomicrobiae bacterium]|nr:lactonase family protein [Verrucomicrobiae bacterium]